MTGSPSLRLATLWNGSDVELSPIEVSTIPDEIRDAINRSINSSTKTYRYVLPTQLLAKLCEPSRDAHAVQNMADMPGSFDARSFCHSIIVPFDRENHSVLGGAPEPYVNNPLRIPAITPSALPAQRNKDGFNDLIIVLDYAESNPQQIHTLLKLVLLATKSRLATVHIVYPVPNRISLDRCVGLIHQFVGVRTGGRRLQGVAAALFDVIGTRFGLFAEVRAGNINRADAVGGDVADLDCVDGQGETVLAVEVKDRVLSVREVEDKLPAAREHGVAEIIYVIRGGVEADRLPDFEAIKSREFASGHNLYEIEFALLLRVTLILLAESGRREFLLRVGSRMDAMGELSDRQAWRDQLMPA